MLAVGIEEAYEDLFNLQKDAQNLSYDEVKNKLKTLTQGQKSDKILVLMATTFRAFCDIADWDAVNSKDGSANNDASSENARVTIDNTVHCDEKKFSDMNLHYNIQIHLPETTNMAVYDAIFQSFKKHLL